MRVLIYTLVSLLLCGLAQPLRAAASDIPTIDDALLEQTLVLAGNNRAELQAALDHCIQKPFMMQAMRFTIASLPAADLGAMSAAMLTENLELALDARSSAQYGQQYDDAIWAHYVLPPRVSQEPLSGWRVYLKDALAADVAGMDSLDAAALAVNRWCGANAGFKQTQRRDQDPLATLTSGYGRCEELCILYIAGCRSVGVPARMAYCPWWAVSDNNHAWVEVYGSDGRWHFVGAAEPADSLDSAWFEGAAHRAPVICSMCFGLPDPLSADVLNYEDAAGARFCRINSTRFYRNTGILSVVLPAELPLPAEGSDPYKLYVAVFNYGALREVASTEFNAGGEARIELGSGRYVISTSAAAAAKTVLVEIVSGETTLVDWETAEAADSELLLVFPED